MNRSEYCRRLADINEAIYDTKKELEDVRFGIMVEDDPSRKEKCKLRQQQLLDEIAELERKAQEIARIIHDIDNK